MRTTRTRVLATMLACTAATLLIPAQAAEATYAGRNGRIAFGMNDSTGRHVYSVRPDGHGLRQLTDGPFTDLCPAYSATGRTIAFCSNRSGTFEVWSMTADGRRLRQLTSLASAAFPDFSPDGTQIAFDGQAAGDPFDEIFVMHSDGSGLHQITSGAGFNDWPAWSPDGHRLAFVSDRTGVEQVWTMRPDGTDATQLTFEPAVHDELPDWRPDGRQIAYSQYVSDGIEKIFVMNADGSGKHQVSSGAGDDFGPAWSPDGRQLAFLRDYGNGDRPVEVMDADGGDTHAVADPTGVVRQYVPAWQPRRDDEEGGHDGLPG